MLSWRNIAARATLFAFLVNVILPFCAVYSATSPTHATSLAALSGKLLICTGEGFKWITHADLQKKGNHTPSHYTCPLCYLAAHGVKDLTMPSSMAAFYGADSSAFALSIHSQNFVNLRVIELFSSRAPPELVS